MEIGGGQFASLGDRRPCSALDTCRGTNLRPYGRTAVKHRAVKKTSLSVFRASGTIVQTKERIVFEMMSMHSRSCVSLITSGGASLILSSCVGLAISPLSRSRKHTSHASYSTIKHTSDTFIPLKTICLLVDSFITVGAVGHEVYRDKWAP